VPKPKGSRGRKVVQFPKPPSRTVRDDRILSHLHLVEPIARSIARGLPPSFDLDDLRGAGHLGLIRAAEAYEPRRKVPFEFYARQKIDRAIRDSVRRRNYRDATGDELDAEHAAAGPGPETAAQHAETRRLLIEAMDVLPADERKVVRMFYLEETTINAAAAAIGTHPSQASRLHHRALRSMRKRVEPLRPGSRMALAA
jgi:RNA polymerase sigma factor (sigma-70 family)